MCRIISAGFLDKIRHYINIYYMARVKKFHIYYGTTGVKRKRCGFCEGCTRPDCGICKCCMDKPRFGGLGKRKQCCELKKCRLLLSTPTPSPLVLQSLTSVEESSVSSPPVKRSKTSEESIVPTVTIEKFLQNSGRKIHHIKGDGNCMFRTFSYAFLNREEHHFHLRSHIVRTINLNQKVFSEYLMPINKPTIKEQVEHMLRDHVWGTHLELKAAAKYLSIAAYNSHCNMTCHLLGVLFSLYH